jgi:chromosome segregation ATPase
LSCHLFQAKERLNILPFEVEHLKEKLNEANAEIRDTKAELSAAYARILELEKQELLSHEQITKLRGNLDTLQEYRLQSEKNLERLKDESEVLSKERDAARIQAGIHQNDNDNLRGSLQAKDVLIAELREELRKMQANCKKLHERDFSSSEVEVLGKSMDDSFLDSGSLESSMFVKKRNESTSSHDHAATHQDIRVHAAKMLFFANQAIEKGRSNRSAVSSIASSNGSDFKPDGQYLQASMKSNRVPSSSYNARKASACQPPRY